MYRQYLYITRYVLRDGPSYVAKKREVSMLSLRMVVSIVLVTFAMCATAQVATEKNGWHPAVSPTVSANTECRAGCNGNTAGCQESYETAVIAASPGMLLYRDSLTISQSWAGADTTGLVKDPQWDITTIPAGDPRPISITVRPIVASCEGRNAHKQSRTHYKWTAVQGRP